MRSRLFSVSTLTLCLFLSCAPAGLSADDMSGEWAEQVQIVYDMDDRSVRRFKLKAWDFEPHLNLDFVWEPDQASLPEADGAISGTGKLVWRVRGSASYDERTIYSTYVGALRDGWPHGEGRLTRRGGEVLEGTWVDGRLHGQGMHLDSDGNRYVGAFVHGVRQGHGRLMLTSGAIYEGPFVDGKRHGTGTTILPGGSSYESVWSRGTEIGNGRTRRLADARIGGLLKAQAGGGEAGRTEFSIAVDQRMTEQAGLQYTHYMDEQNILIFPSREDMIAAWNGENEINSFSFDNLFADVDLEDVPAFVEVGIETTDDSRVKLEKYELQVSQSQVYRQPMLSVIEHGGCVGLRPAFSLVNNGWGAVQNARLSLHFANPYDETIGRTRDFSVDVGSFDEGGDVSVLGALSEAGVDVDRLANERFQCASMHSLPICRAQLSNSGAFGELTDFVDGEWALTVGLKGQLDYQWTDDFGNVYDSSQPLSANIQLTVLEIEGSLAECGAGFTGAPAALRYQTVHLPSSDQNYVVDMPLRGNRSISNHTALLKIYSDKSSIHNFQAVAQFGDGSIRQSKPVSLFYMKPRETVFVPAQPAQCYLDERYNPGC